MKLFSRVLSRKRLKEGKLPAALCSYHRRPKNRRQQFVASCTPYSLCLLSSWKQNTAAAVVAPVIAAGANRIAAAAVTARVPPSTCSPRLSYLQRFFEGWAAVESHSVHQFGKTPDYSPHTDASRSFDAFQLLSHNYRKHLPSSRLLAFLVFGHVAFTLFRGIWQAP